jgi:hypothetical protein
MEAAIEIYNEALQDQELRKDLEICFKNTQEMKALCNVICKITQKVLEKRLIELGLMRRPKKQKKIVCYRCQELGHMAKTCKNQVKCKYCKKEHFTRDCPDRICKECKRKHPKGQCKKVNKWCKWCKSWNQHESKDCPNSAIFRRIAKLENLKVSSRLKSSQNLRRQMGLTPRGKKPRGRFRGGANLKTNLLKQK